MEDATDASTGGEKRRLNILLSTLIVGGGSLVTVACGVVRGKVISLVVGPAGIGLQGLLQALLRTASTIAALGLHTSGVREVARLRGEDKADELGHTLRALRLATLVLGALAALVLLLFQRPFAAAFLDDANRDWMVAVVGLGVLAQVQYAAYDAYLRGFRRVALVTKAAIVANVLSTAIGSGLVAWRGDAGIVWALIAQPVLVVGIAAIAGRDVRTHLGAPDRRRTAVAFRRVIQIGVVLALTGFMTTGVQLAARVLVARTSSLDDAGYFQAAWAVSVLYLGFVMGAMSQDYYPRLAEMGANRDAVNQAVNEQAKLSFLLAGPATLGLLTLSAPVVTLLYSTKFAPTVELLRWQLLGDVLKIGTWTLGYLVLAQGRPRVYFATELSWNVAYIGVLAALLPSMGLAATAVAYVASSAIYFVVLCFVTNQLVGFRWDRNNVALMVVVTLAASAVMAAHLMLAGWWPIIVGGLVTLVFGLYALRRILRETGLAAKLRRKAR